MSDTCFGAIMDVVFSDFDSADRRLLWAKRKSRLDVRDVMDRFPDEESNRKGVAISQAS